MEPKGTGQPTVGFEFTPEPSDKDWSKIRKDFERESKEALEAYRKEIEKTWNEKANAQLKQETLSRYMQGVSFQATNDGVDVMIDGWFPVAVEEGQEPWDMKPALLGGRKSRIIRMKNGNYRTVSKNSPNASWWHPGIEAKKISEQVKAEEKRIREKTISPVLDDFSKRIEI